MINMLWPNGSQCNTIVYGKASIRVSKVGDIEYDSAALTHSYTCFCEYIYPCYMSHNTNYGYVDHLKLLCVTD